MKHLLLNLKRFDVPRKMNGVNNLAEINHWGSFIVESTQDGLRQYSVNDVHFVQYFPEAHILSALSSRKVDSNIEIGCQGVYREDTEQNGNFGAFTTNRLASAMRAMGCTATIIGHCEERNDKMEILKMASAEDTTVVNNILNREVKAALAQGINVLYCVGERSCEQERWKEVLKEQLDIGLQGVDNSKVVVAYEPVWSIGPGKKPADKLYIEKVVNFIKEIANGIDVVYGGGLKKENAGMLATIPELDGGLIALTRFDADIGFYPDEYLEIIRTYLE